MQNTIHLETLGCRLNQIETEGAARFFFDEGFKISSENISAKSKEDSDVVLCILNTCTVTTKAEQKARRLIRLFLSKFPESAVLVTGCYAASGRKELLAMDKRIAVLEGTYKSRLAKIPSAIKKYLEENASNNGCSPEKIAAFLQKEFSPVLIQNPSKKLVSIEPFLLSTDTFFSHSRASIKIQDGCNNACTYCAIHIARGAAVSLPAKEVISRIQSLEQSGHKEVVITAVNIAQYRGEYNGSFIDFAELLSMILKQTSTIRIRLSSLYPQIVDEKLYDSLLSPRLCPHFHLSVQSGSDAILERMKRPYNAEAVFKAVSIIKKAKQNPFLACDIITGFPGETDADFNQTMALVKDLGFTWIHAFPFSSRPGTPASTFKPKIPEAVSGARVKELFNLAVKNKTEYINSLINTVRPAIAENIHGKITPGVLSENPDRKIIHAVTDNFIHVEIPVKNDFQVKGGDLINVKIKEALYDEIVKGSEQEAYGEIV